MKLFIPGHNGFVGSALARRFKTELNVELVLRTRQQLDLLNQSAVQSFFKNEKPDAAIIAAAKVGDIYANNAHQAEFIYENITMAANCIRGAFTAGVNRLLFLSSCCIYPYDAPQPIPEECLLTGPLDPRKEAYAIAKISALKLCEYYRRNHGVLYHSAVSANLYGPRDNYHPLESHVIPALIQRFHEAKDSNQPEVMAWGTGSARREFMHVDDFADACAFLLRNNTPPDLVNVGTGNDITIKNLADYISEAINYKGRVLWDHSKLDGMSHRLLDISRLTALGWKSKINVRDGLRMTCASYIAEKQFGILRH